jgi:hypothetical protein
MCFVPEMNVECYRKDDTVFSQGRPGPIPRGSASSMSGGCRNITPVRRFRTPGSPGEREMTCHALCAWHGLEQDQDAGYAPVVTSSDGAIDFAAKVEASNAERVLIEKGEDFIAHEGGPIELTSTGLKRLVAGHVAGHDVVIEIDKCEVLLVRGPRA